MKKLLCAALAACMLLGLCACRDSGTPTPKPSGSWEEAKKNAAEITVYVDASNIYGSYIKGSDEAYVKDAIEKKFYEDTGNAVNFQVNYESHATFSTKFGGVMTTGKWDMAVSYLGQAGLDEIVLKQDVSMDLADLLDNYEHIGEAIAPEVMNATTTLTGEVVGIPSSVKSKTKGILIRKDYMTKAGYTEDKVEAAASGGKLKFCQTIDDFTDMMRKMKAEIPACTMPLIGNSYDIEFAITARAARPVISTNRSFTTTTAVSIRSSPAGFPRGTTRCSATNTCGRKKACGKRTIRSRPRNSASPIIPTARARSTAWIPIF